MSAIGGYLGLNLRDEEAEKMLLTMARRQSAGCEQTKIPGGGLMRAAALKPEQQDLAQGKRLLALTFDGRIYNAPEVREELHSLGHRFQGDSDEELILHSFAQWGKDCLQHFNGVFAFAIWDSAAGRLFLARDRIGVKPLFYRAEGGTFLFASEMKTILAAPGVRAELDSEGAAQLILLGPGRIPGSGVFRGIQALKPGCWVSWRNGLLTRGQYWKLEDREHEDSFEETAQTVRHLVTDAIHRQMGERMGTFLSGGLDSSIISEVCAEEEKKKGRSLRTFSVDYLHNDRYFQPGKFLPDSDDAYIRTMTEAIGSIHNRTVLSAQDLIQELKTATIARDLPGMGDVDFSLQAFCRSMSRMISVALSGECADEIFGGYPWFRDPEIRGAEGFPWARNSALRCRLLAHKREDGESYIMDLYRDTCRSTDVLPGAAPEERRIREMVNLNFTWFMQTLLERNDRLNCGIEIRVPFCDYRIAEYLYSVPWQMKNYEGREKGLLRYAARGLLPESVRMRKKSPYPKTFDPQYERLVWVRLRKLMQEDGPLWDLVDRQTVQQILDGETDEPWYGQLMQRPQFMAYLLQIDFWLRHYQIDLIF